MFPVSGQPTHSPRARTARTRVRLIRALIEVSLTPPSHTVHRSKAALIIRLMGIDWNAALEVQWQTCIYND